MPHHDSSLTPRTTQALETAGVTRSFARLHGRAWGIAMGLLAGLGLLVATWTLVFIGGQNVGSHLGLLSNFFPGYSVTIHGGLIGFVYAFVTGYAFGRLIGSVYERLLPHA
jgi:riboflavin transporter FmnP